MSEINCYGNEQVFGQVLPNWALVRLVDAIGEFKVGNFVMKEGSWGLTYCNDPSFVFDLDPQIDFTIKDPEGDPPTEGYWDTHEHYCERLQGNVEDGYRLVASCIEAGWNPKEGGLAAWLCDRMRKHLDGCNWQPELIYER